MDVRAPEYFKESGIDPALLSTQDWIYIIEKLLYERDHLRRIRHLALACRYATIDAMNDFSAEPRMRSWHARLELDRILEIEEDLQGLA